MRLLCVCVSVGGCVSVEESVPVPVWLSIKGVKSNEHKANTLKYFGVKNNLT